MSPDQDDVLALDERRVLAEVDAKARQERRLLQGDEPFDDPAQPSVRIVVAGTDVKDLTAGFTPESRVTMTLPSVDVDRIGLDDMKY